MAESNGPVPKGEKGYQNPASGIGVGFWNALDVHEDTPELQWPANIASFDKMRRQDAQVIQTLRAVMLPIRRTQWRIDPNGADEAIVEHVANDLGLPIQGRPGRTVTRTRNRFDWNQHLRLALLSLVFGHSYFEQVYEIVDGRAHLAKLGWRPPRTIRSIDVARDGGLIAIHQDGILGTANDITIPVDRLVAYVNEREGGNWLGQSLLRPAYKFWLLKDLLLRVQAQSVDRNGMGVPVYESAEVDPTVQGDDRTAREQRQIDEGQMVASGVRSGDDSGVSLPHGAKLSLLGVEGTLPDANTPIRYYDEQIARAVLANFLTLGGDNSTGSYALGDTFQDFFTLSLQTVALDIANTTTQHVVEDLVDLNYGPDVPAPRVVFDEIGSKHPVTAQAIYQLVQVGALRMDDPLEEYLRTTYGLPPIDPDTRREVPTTTNAPKEAA